MCASCRILGRPRCPRVPRLPLPRLRISTRASSWSFTSSDARNSTASAKNSLTRSTASSERLARVQLGPSFPCKLHLCDKSPPRVCDKPPRRVDTKELYRLQVESKTRMQEVRDLQRALSDAHVMLFDERQKLLALQAQNDELRIQEAGEGGRGGGKGGLL